MINGQEVSEMLHDDVVNLIRAARDLERDGKLVLTVQQKGLYYKEIFFFVYCIICHNFLFLI